MCSRKIRKHRQTTGYYCRLLHNMAVSRFDHWPKSPKLKHSGITLPRISVKYLFTVTRCLFAVLSTSYSSSQASQEFLEICQKRFEKSFAKRSDLYWILMNRIRMEAHKWRLGKGWSRCVRGHQHQWAKHRSARSLSICSGSNFCIHVTRSITVHYPMTLFVVPV